MNACRSWHCLHSNVRRSMPRVFVGSISLIDVSPPHAGHSASTPMGADWGACTLCPFALEGSASPWKVQVRLGRLMLASRSCLSLGPIDQPSLCKMEQVPNFKTQPLCRSLLMPLHSEFFRKTARLAREREVLECASEQNWRNAGNDHFRSALRTCRRSVFGWQFLPGHVMSFHARLLGTGPIGEERPVRRGASPRMRQAGLCSLRRLEVRAFQAAARY